MNKLLFTELRGKNAAVLVSERRVIQIDFEPETAGEQTGNIYIGRVRSLVKNLNAAFVEYQPGLNGYYSLTDNKTHVFADGESHPTLKAGDEIVVQVARAAVRTKDAVLSSELSLAGQYVVAFHRPGYLGISGKIQDKEWKKQMKRQWEEQADREHGLLLRTNACTVSADEVWREAEQLFRRMDELLAAARCRVCHSLLYEAEDFAVQMARGARVADTEELVTDSPRVFGRLQELSSMGFPIPVRFYEDSYPLAALYQLHTALDRALARTVWLKSGGYLVIEPTEAMTVIDVNSGKNTGKRQSEDMYLQTNLEAAAEIALQLRLRNLSGIILVDFIDMKADSARQELLHTLRRHLAPDPVKTVLVDMTALGLVEITRKKIRRPLMEQLKSPGKASDS